MLEFWQVLLPNLALPNHNLLLSSASLIIILPTVGKPRMIRIILRDGIEGSLLLLLLIQSSRLGGKVLEISQLLAIGRGRFE